MAHQLKATLKIAETALGLNDLTCADGAEQGERCEECIGCINYVALRLVRHELEAFGSVYYKAHGEPPLEQRLSRS